MARAKSKKVTERQRKLATALTVSENLSPQEKAEAALGYRGGEIAAITATPEVARAVKAGLVRRLVAEAAPLSMGLLIKVVKQGHATADRGEPPTNTQTDAAKSLMQIAGLQAASEDLRIDKTPGEMTGNELEEALRRLEDEHRRRTAIDVESSDSAPDNAPIEGPPIDKVEDLFS